MPNIKPISDLRNYSEVLRDVTIDSPVFLTKSFIEEETGDIELAKKTVSDIVTTNDSLSIFPEMGQRLLINLETKIEYRYLLCHNYLSFYRYLDRTIYIDRILNSRRDYLRILLDEVH